MGKNNNSKFHIRLPLILAIGLVAGILIGAKIGGNEPNKPNLQSSIHKFANIMNYINKAYVDTVDTEDLVEVAITKMLEKLDPHSVYISPKEVELNKPQLTGEFSGIGIEFNVLQDTIYVVSPLSGGPSEKLGIRPADRIVDVDGENVAGIGITTRRVVELLRGKKGSTVKVGIKRKGVDETLYFNIVRDKIPQHSVDATYMIDDEIGYVKISRFSATTYDEFKESLTTLQGEGMKKMVLDLRGNPGGYMDKAVKIADEFLSDGKLIVYTKGKERRYNNSFHSRNKGSFEHGSLIVLIDEGSASASEIVSGAMQDNDRALVVGRRSFGKGLVQMPIPLNDGSELRLTISRYYTPSGRSIQKPYGEEVDDYYGDRASRFEHGEFFHVDSIKLNDSLKYSTVHGRTVYGGGGIMPDYFVPLDTTGNSSYYLKLLYSGSVVEFINGYYNKNEKKLKKMEYETFLNNFEITDKMMGQLVKVGEDHDVPMDEKGLEKSDDLVKLALKAQIARRLWGSSAYYQIINDENEILQQALKLFPEADELAKNYEE
ncbi:S41 family peptidase [Aureibacter tunicatorum]|uniref:Carboxyl-terminal processing protease n=1 Tax=Aureibacter tunicatorum TaxID=866807 RepID=A0AAE3XQK0_9BACT|nr:S41 family peptidase [Aureibacter tunicatorum]MDR6239569.1 carboxyl-terminal processing protease [Aureibacter tunicatorum]BDD04046.1 peptidase S41 [Aureibacter tunicatorum]